MTHCLIFVTACTTALMFHVGNWTPHDWYWQLTVACAVQSLVRHFCLHSWATGTQHTWASSHNTGSSFASCIGLICSLVSFATICVFCLLYINSRSFCICIQSAVVTVCQTDIAVSAEYVYIQRFATLLPCQTTIVCQMHCNTVRAKVTQHWFCVSLTRALFEVHSIHGSTTATGARCPQRCCLAHCTVWWLYCHFVDLSVSVLHSGNLDSLKGCAAAAIGCQR